MREDAVPEPRRSLFTFTHLFTAVEIKRRFDATWSVNGLLWEHYIVRQRCLIWSFLIGSSQVALHLPHSSCKSEVNLHHIFETRCSLFLDTKRFYSFLHYSVILSSSHWIILPFPRVFLFFVSPFNAWLAPFVQPARTEGYGREGGETRALISISRQRNEMSVSPAHDATLEFQTSSRFSPRCQGDGTKQLYISSIHPSILSRSLPARVMTSPRDWNVCVFWNPVPHVTQQPSTWTRKGRAPSHKGKGHLNEFRHRQNN